jgi:hypothetical protein
VFFGRHISGLIADQFESSFCWQHPKSHTMVPVEAEIISFLPVSHCAPTSKATCAGQQSMQIHLFEGSILNFAWLTRA